MNSILPRRAMDEVSRSLNPFDEILKKVGDLSQFKVWLNYVLLAAYVKPERTRGGIILTDTSKEEDIWQGKSGMVLKLGKDAFQDDDAMAFNGQTAEVGEWVVFKLGDAWKLTVREWPCLLVRDASIKMTIPHPSLIV